MKYEKDEYEKLIDASPLFSLDREKEHAAYQREALKMVEHLYCYLMAVNLNDYEPYGVEIVDVARRCIGNYDPSAGRFLNYFSSAWKKTYGHIVGKELVKDTFRGIHFSEDDERNFRKYMKLANSMGMDTNSPEFKKKISDAMGLSIDEINALMKMDSSKPVSGSYINEEGEESNLIDQLDSGQSTEADIIQIETAKELLDLIEITYDQLQDRQKPMLAMLITSKISLMIGEDTSLLDYFKTKAFYDNGIYEESIKRGEQIQAKEIADQFGVAEASASRSWKTFKEKVKEKDSKRR